MKITCLDLNCPERKGKECQHQEEFKASEIFEGKNSTLYKTFMKATQKPIQNKLSEQQEKRYDEAMLKAVVSSDRLYFDEVFKQLLATELALQKSEMEEKVEKARKEERKRVYLEIAKNPLTIIGILKDN